MLGILLVIEVHFVLQEYRCGEIGKVIFKVFVGLGWF